MEELARACNELSLHPAEAKLKLSANSVPKQGYDVNSTRSKKMQTGKNAMESVKEKASNVAASANSGMEKTKATLQGQGEMMTAHGPGEKAMAEQRKEARKAEAEFNKQDAMNQNAAQRCRDQLTFRKGVGGYVAFVHGPRPPCGNSAPSYVPSFGQAGTVSGQPRRDI